MQALPSAQSGIQRDPHYNTTSRFRDDEPEVECLEGSTFLVEQSRCRRIETRFESLITCLRMLGDHEYAKGAWLTGFRTRSEYDGISKHLCDTSLFLSLGAVSGMNKQVLRRFCVWMRLFNSLFFIQKSEN